MTDSTDFNYFPIKGAGLCGFISYFETVLIMRVKNEVVQGSAAADPFWHSHMLADRRHANPTRALGANARCEKRSAVQLAHFFCHLLT